MGEESKVSKLFFTVASNGNNDIEWQEINTISDINITPMSRGWSRNEANEIIKEHIMPRTKGNIDNYGIKLRKCDIKI